MEPTFEIRSYSKSELASLYSPYTTQKAAVRKLNRWIALQPGLQARLDATGITPCAKCYTPLQVRLIVEAIGGDLLRLLVIPALSRDPASHSLQNHGSRIKCGMTHTSVIPSYV